MVVVQVWSLYLDLEESLGTVETTKAAYDRALELKVPSIPLEPTLGLHSRDKR